jgi:hypothetical protein
VKILLGNRGSAIVTGVGEAATPPAFVGLQPLCQRRETNAVPAIVALRMVMFRKIALCYFVSFVMHTGICRVIIWSLIIHQQKKNVSGRKRSEPGSYAGKELVLTIKPKEGLVAVVKIQ